MVLRNEGAHRCGRVFRPDVTVTHQLLHGKETCVLGDSGYTGADKRPELVDSKAEFLIAAKRSDTSAGWRSGPVWEFRAQCRLFRASLADSGLRLTYVSGSLRRRCHCRDYG